MKYKGKFIDDQGETIYCWFEAPSEEALRKHLQGKGWQVVSITRGWKSKIERELSAFGVPPSVFGAIGVLVGLYILLQLGVLDWGFSVLKKIGTVLGGGIILTVAVIAFLRMIRVTVKESVREAVKESLENAPARNESEK